MTYKGRIHRGVVVLEPGNALAEGTEVSVRPLRKTAGKGRGTTLYERLKGVVGQAKGLPTDAAANLDHYLYGLPKRK